MATAILSQPSDEIKYIYLAPVTLNGKPWKTARMNTPEPSRIDIKTTDQPVRVMRVNGVSQEWVN